jgi:hypothetical protein
LAEHAARMGEKRNEYRLLVGKPEGKRTLERPRRRWVSAQLHALAALPRGKEPQYPLDRWLGGPQSRSGRSVEEKVFDPTGT